MKNATSNVEPAFAMLRRGMLKAADHDKLCARLGNDVLVFDIKPGDDVIVPSLVFVLRGAKPVFIEVRADTLNLEEKRFETLLTFRTKAIIQIHYAGSSAARMFALGESRRGYGLAETHVTVHNVDVLNLFVRLGFALRDPTLTFHQYKP
jgi:dTDP-4-amino-4,6-dideoxygalactose transaminase